MARCRYYAAVMTDRVKLVTARQVADAVDVYREAFGASRLPHPALVRSLPARSAAEAEAQIRDVLVERERARVRCLSCSRIWWRWEHEECPSCGTPAGEAVAPEVRKRKGFILPVGALTADDGKPARWTAHERTLWVEPGGDGAFLLLVSDPLTVVASIGSDAATVLLTEENSTVFERAYVKAAAEEMRKRLRTLGWQRGV